MTLMLFLPCAYLRAAFAFFVGAGFLCFPAHSAAENASQNPQNPAPEPPQESKSQPPYRMAVHVDLVNVEVTVTDARGNFVGDLVRENFRVLDEGVPQPLTHFASVEAPAQVLVLVETGPAVYLIHQQHLLAAYALLEGLAPDDQVALGTYDQSARLAMTFTADKNALAGAIDRLRYNLGMADLNLFDSLAAALDWLAPLPGKKAIVLLSTGLDTSGAGRYEALLQKLRASEVVILPVALGGELREPPGKSDKKPSGRNHKKKETTAPPAIFATDATGLSFEKADQALEAIALETGGRAYFPRDAREFTGIYHQIAALLRHQYSLGFQPTMRDARFHRIEVQIVDASGRVLAPAEASGPSARAPAGGIPVYHLRARRGYLAPGP